jgi:LPXTG-site transpeptidase (sortase) family protein
MSTIIKLAVLLTALAGILAGAKIVRATASLGPGRRSRRARRAILVLGAAAVLAGLALLGAGAYTYVGTAGGPGDGNPLLIERVEQGGIFDMPVHEAAVPSLSPTPVPVVPEVPPPLGDRPFRIVIDRIGVDAGVFTYGMDENRVPQVPLNAEDVAWYDFSARPGTGSNAVFAGHVTWNGRAVFFHLDELAAGDRIRLVGEDGTELSYNVTEVFLVDAGDASALALMGPTEADIMTIVTCGGTFYSTGDPVFGGDYTDRLIVRAALSGVNVVSAPGAASDS